jgi:ubiquinone/menaquinone biosynthesis C-methylase UbiE
MVNAAVCYTNAKNQGFAADTFDIALCGFMAWDDCFDFDRIKFTQPDTKAKEIWRVLRAGGRFVCCSWLKQEDVSWMEAAILRHHPATMEDPEYKARRPIGMAYENQAGYEVILRNAGFKEIRFNIEKMTFVSTDEEEWWRQMQHIGWDSFLENIGNQDADHLEKLKAAIFTDLQPYKHADGIHFEKEVFFMHAEK